ncbi:hypothetical protein TNIN_296661 [Trichonephila inaurata madagascariensis]|uniref:Uncharacterized protein n=1 Tax=Trichonephila inaurata madagascariensis TaxID=2747483 RepID=A0A8X6YK99_9ARAC|nr:hypothetical protein TNIN_296661 [Trichonephila inaurata madagascariensis]
MNRSLRSPSHFVLRSLCTIRRNPFVPESPAPTARYGRVGRHGTRHATTSTPLVSLPPLTNSLAQRQTPSVSGDAFNERRQKRRDLEYVVCLVQILRLIMHVEKEED